MKVLNLDAMAKEDLERRQQTETSSIDALASETQNGLFRTASNDTALFLSSLHDRMLTLSQGIRRSDISTPASELASRSIAAMLQEMREVVEAFNVCDDEQLLRALVNMCYVSATTARRFNMPFLTEAILKAHDCFVEKRTLHIGDIITEMQDRKQDDGRLDQ